MSPRRSPEQTIRRAMRKRWRGRTLSYKVDLIPDELATAAIEALRDAGQVIVRREVLQHLVVAEERLSAASGCRHLSEARAALEAR